MLEDPKKLQEEVEQYVFRTKNEDAVMRPINEVFRLLELLNKRERIDTFLGDDYPRAMEGAKDRECLNIQPQEEEWVDSDSCFYVWWIGHSDRMGIGFSSFNNRLPKE